MKRLIFGILVVFISLQATGQVTPANMSATAKAQFKTALEIKDSTWIDNFIKNLGYVATTANTTELNILDGALISTTELNRLVGITSSVQNQINAKQDALTADTDYLTPGTAATTYEPVKGADDNYVTDAEKVKLSNLSGTNTGDQDLSVKENTLLLNESLFSVVTDNLYRLPTTRGQGFQMPVTAIQSTPPVSPVEGDRYIVGVSATGDWTGRLWQIAVYYNGAWVFDDPLISSIAYVSTEEEYYQLTETTGWQVIALGEGTGGGATINDATVSTTETWSSDKIYTDITIVQEDVNAKVDTTEVETIDIEVVDIDFGGYSIKFTANRTLEISTEDSVFTFEPTLRSLK